MGNLRQLTSAQQAAEKVRWDMKGS